MASFITLVVKLIMHITLESKFDKNSLSLTENIKQSNNP